MVLLQVRGREMTSLQSRQLASLRLSLLLSLGLSVEWWGFGTSPHRNSDKRSLTRYEDFRCYIIYQYSSYVCVCVGGGRRDLINNLKIIIGLPLNFIIKLLKYGAWISFLQDGVVRLHSSSQEPLVFTACLDGIVRGWDLRSGQCVKEWHGHSDQILDLAVSRSVLVKRVGTWNEVP